MGAPAIRRLARRTAQTRLELERTGLATKRHRGGRWRVSEGAVSQWLKRGRAGGIEALSAHPPKGVAPRLTAEQKAQIPHLLAKGAEAYGFRGNVWTANRVAEVIDRTFGVRYHRDHVGRILREAGWSRQQPIERATQRDEQAIKDWYERRWPALKKKPRRKNGRSSG
jgi:transposase